MSRFQILMKPTALAKNYGKSRGAEFLQELEATNKDEAARIARRDAESMGFRGYAITKITEVPQ